MADSWAQLKLSKARPEGRALLAFSLIEIIMVLVVMVIVAAIAVPRYAQADARYRLEGAARRIQSDIALAQNASRADGQMRTAAFSAASSEYKIGSAGTGLLAGQVTYRVVLGNPPYKAGMQLDGKVPTFSFDIDGRGEIVGTGTITLGVGRDSIIVTIDKTVTVSSILVTFLPPGGLNVSEDDERVEGAGGK